MTSVQLRCMDAECARTLADVVRHAGGTTVEDEASVILWDGKSAWQPVKALPSAIIMLGESVERLPHPARRHYHYLLPVRAEELCRKLREIFHSVTDGPHLTLPPPLHYDARLRLLTRSDTGTKEELTELESRLFEALAGQDGILTRAYLLESVWGYSETVETRTLEAHIYRLRQKLESLQEGMDMRVEIVTHEEGYQVKIIG